MTLREIIDRVEAHLVDSDDAFDTPLDEQLFDGTEPQDDE